MAYPVFHEPMAPWIVVDAAEHAFVCGRCKGRQVFTVPVVLELWVAASAKFITAHARCKPVADENTQGTML